MNLAIDIGNTRVKAALFDKNELIELKYYSGVDAIISDVDFFKMCDAIVIGSVVDGLDEYYKQLAQLKETILFTSETRIPLKNLYKTTATLGSDRIAASIGAYYLYSNTNVLVIDMGTCIKYNFTNSQNHYLGGSISPGLQMRFKALHQFTSKLPLLQPDTLKVELIGDNTQNSLLSGVINGIIAEMDGIINQYKEQYPDLVCVITGGDCEHFAKQLKNSIFVHPNLVLRGLNNILNFNINSK